jgi:hypothetical protein
VERMHDEDPKRQRRSLLAHRLPLAALARLISYSLFILEGKKRQTTIGPTAHLSCRG